GAGIARPRATLVAWRPRPGTGRAGSDARPSGGGRPRVRSRRRTPLRRRASLARRVSAPSLTAWPAHQRAGFGEYESGSSRFVQSRQRPWTPRGLLVGRASERAFRALGLVAAQDSPRASDATRIGSRGPD